MPVNSICFRACFQGRSRAILCPTFSEDSMRPVSFPRIGLAVSIGIVFCLTFLGANRAFAQQATAQLLGTVKDPSGAVVAAAKVSLRNTGTNIVRSATTNQDGGYLFTLVPIGAYELTVEQQGFEKYVRKGITLEINQNGRVDVTLAVGASTLVVEVTENVTLVDTVSDTIGNSVIGESVQRAPLNGRDVLDLALLQPGVTETNGDTTAAGKYSIAGGRSDSVTFLLDGGLNNNLLDNSVVFNPNPDTIAEFRILQNNDWLNAASFFDNADGLPRDVLKRNQYGGTLGGPILLPKVNGRDRFFFFVGYQGQRLSQQESTGLGTGFTPAEL